MKKDGKIFDFTPCVPVHGHDKARSAISALTSV